MSERRSAGRRNVVLFVAYRTTTRAILFAPWMFHFVTEVRGLTASQYGLLKSFYYFSAMIAELPTGVIADRIGRRPALVCGALVQAIACLIAVHAHAFGSFACSEILFGLGMALCNGADSALLHDALVAEGRAHEYARAEGAAHASWLMASAIALPLSDRFLVRDGDPVLTYWITGAALLIGVGCALAMHESSRRIRPSTREITSGALRDVVHAPGLLRLIVYSVGVFVLVRCATMSFFNPALAALGVPVDRYGSVLAATNVFAALAAWQTHRGLARSGERALLIGMPVALVVMYGGLAMFDRPAAALLFCLQGAVFGAYPVAVRSLLNRLVSSPERRATVLSVESMAVRTAGGLAVIGCGRAIDALPLDRALLITAAVGCIPFLCVPFLRRAVRAGGR